MSFLFPQGISPNGASSSFAAIIGDTTNRGIGNPIGTQSHSSLTPIGAFDNGSGLYRTLGLATSTSFIGWDYGVGRFVVPNRITFQQFKNLTNNSQNATELAVEVSNDLSAWTEISRFNPAQDPGDSYSAITTHDVPNAPLARAVRLRPTTLNGSNFWLVSEVEIIENI